MSVKIAGIDFDNVVYDAPVDVLYLNVGSPRVEVDWDETPEGDGVAFGPDGSIVGLTILSPRWRLEHDGEIVLTLPGQQIHARDLGNALTT